MGLKLLSLVQGLAEIVLLPTWFHFQQVLTWWQPVYVLHLVKNRILYQRFKVESIVGLENAKKMNGVTQISVVHGVGETITEIDSSGARMGFIIAQDENAETAIKDCEQALECIQVEIK